MTPTWGDSSAESFIKAASGSFGSTRALVGPDSPTASSSSTLGDHRDDHVIEMSDLSSNSHWKKGDPEPKHFEEEDSEHKQAPTRFVREDAETARFSSSGYIAVPQANSAQHGQKEDGNSAGLWWFSFGKKSMYLILGALLVAVALLLCSIIEGAVELSKED